MIKIETFNSITLAELAKHLEKRLILWTKIILMNDIEIETGRYRHYKGDEVEVIGKALHSETLDEFVIYKHMTGKRAGETHYWVRPLQMFLENVETNGAKLPRFIYVNQKSVKGVFETEGSSHGSV